MTEKRRQNIRNIAIIAHVDHGKTTLVDSLLKQTGEFNVKPEETQECVLDSNDLERERGITILAKTTSVFYKDTTINILDTPGHADFGGEVERILRMVDGCLLLVDAFDGPMPQTRFVLKKSLELGLQPIVVINKVDRPGADPHLALDKTFSLFMDLGASDAQLDFSTVYASGRDGWAATELDQPRENLSPLFEAILKKVPGPLADSDKPLQMQVTMLDQDDFVGRVSTGRIYAGTIKKNQNVVLLQRDGSRVNSRVTKIIKTAGLKRMEMETAEAGDIAIVAGIQEAQVGDTIASTESPEALPPLHIDEPTLVMEFLVNDSPFAGKEGQFLTSRHLRERLMKEQEINVGLQITENKETGSFRVAGRGELHISVLIERMRREGYELAVSKPEVIDREVDGILSEPAEDLVLDVEEQYQGAVLEFIGSKSATMKDMKTEHGRIRLEYVITARSLIGFKSDFMSLTRGTGLMHHSFHGYIPKTSADRLRPKGVLIAQEKGETAAYSLDNLQNRGTLFVGPQVAVYGGMIIGESARDSSLVVNPCKTKQLTNMRAAGSDDNILLAPPRLLTLEQALEFIETDELVEVTPKSIRLRKKYLDHTERKRFEKKTANA